jgi:hypothetical protein
VFFFKSLLHEIYAERLNNVYWCDTLAGLTRSNCRFKNWYNDFRTFETQLVVPGQFKYLKVLILVHVFTTHYEIICMQIFRHMSQPVPPCVEKINCVVAQKACNIWVPKFLIPYFLFKLSYLI